MMAMENGQEWPIVGRSRQLMRSAIVLADGDLIAAELMLQQAYTDQRQFRDSAILMDAGLLLAHACLRQGREANALAILDDVLGHHARHNTPGLLLLAGAPIVVPLLRLALAHQLHTRFATRMLRLLSPDPGLEAQPVPARDSPGPAEMLTARELEVLRLIALGASNGEIATGLVISMATVKKHINNIFAKLHTRSRTHALVCARERGLL